MKDGEYFIVYNITGGPFASKFLLYDVETAKTRIVETLEGLS